MLFRRRSSFQGSAKKECFCNRKPSVAVHETDKKQLKFIAALLLFAFVVAAIATYASLVMYPATP
jgi:hypothetical protein